DLGAVRGSGPEGAVLAGDLVQVNRGEAATPSAAPSPGSRPLGPTPDVPRPSPQPLTPVSRNWQIMAERMTQAWTTIPHFALVREIDASALRDMRSRIAPAVSQRLNASVTYTDLRVKVIAAAIRRRPRINVSWHDGS